MSNTALTHSSQTMLDIYLAIGEDCLAISCYCQICLIIHVFHIHTVFSLLEAPYVIEAPHENNCHINFLQLSLTDMTEAPC